VCPPLLGDPHKRVCGGLRCLVRSLARPTCPRGTRSVCMRWKISWTMTTTVRFRKATVARAARGGLKGVQRGPLNKTQRAVLYKAVLHRNRRRNQQHRRTHSFPSQKVGRTLVLQVRPVLLRALAPLQEEARCEPRQAADHVPRGPIAATQGHGGAGAPLEAHGGHQAVDAGQPHQTTYHEVRATPRIRTQACTPGRAREYAAPPRVFWGCVFQGLVPYTPLATCPKL
jgi:hypothetical protein